MDTVALAQKRSILPLPTLENGAAARQAIWAACGARKFTRTLLFYLLRTGTMMPSFSNYTLSHRFAVLIGVFALGFAAYGYWSLKTLDELKVNGPLYQRIVQGKDLIADVLPPPEYIIESYLVSLQLAGAADQAEQDQLIARLTILKGEYDTRHAYWLKQGLEPQLSAVFLTQAHEPALAFYGAAFSSFIPAVRRQDKPATAGAIALMKRHYDAHRKAIDEAVQLTNLRNGADEAQAGERIASATVLLLVILALSLGCGIVVASLIVRGVLASLGGEPVYAAGIANRIAKGDLTGMVEVRSGDQRSLLFAMHSMQATLAGTVIKIKDTVDCVSTGSHQIALGNSDLAVRTEEQANSLAESAASMEQLTNIVKRNADSAEQANELATSACAVAMRGGDAVTQVVHTMGQINESSRKIVDIIAVIDGISFQTNILALNAAVEAARAGEQGRGFAVVAAEVRNLAQRSATAAKEIKTLIESSVEKVDIGARLVDQAGATMNEVVASITRVSTIITDITASSHAQSEGIENINNAIKSMDEVTHQNAALVEEAAAAAESLREQASKLARAMDVFTLAAAVPAVRAIGQVAPKRKARPAPIRKIAQQLKLA
jgi:methyl-accepting chemotaxis protein